MKKIFLALYFVFDFLMSLFPIAFFLYRAWDNRNTFLAAGNWSIMYFLALYLLLTSVVGIVLSKKKNLDDENLTVSKNWLLPIYIVNVIGAFFLMFPFWTEDIRFQTMYCRYLLKTLLLLNLSWKLMRMGESCFKVLPFRECKKSLSTKAHRHTAAFFIKS